MQELREQEVQQPEPTVQITKRSRRTGKTNFLFGLVLLVILVGIAVVVSHDNKNKTPALSSAPAAKVSITSNGFSPAAIVVNVNQPVVWTDTDSAEHQISTDPFPKDNEVAGFKSDIISTDQTYSFIFDKAGTYTYHDNLNPYKFTGEIIVK